MKSVVVQSATAIAAFGLVVSASAADRCAAARLDRLPVCVEGEGGVVLADNEIDAVSIRDSIEAARPVFAAAFGRPAPDYAVVFNSPSNDEIATLEAKGYSAVLPWVSKAALRSMLEKNIREAIKKQAPGLSKEQEDAAVAAALDRTGDKVAGAAIPAHEIGHLWFIKSFWPNDRGEGHYGGPAEDWLDETAAVMMESGDLEASRRARFGKAWNEGKVVTPLAQFITMTHPAKAMAEKILAAGGTLPEGGGSAVTVATGNDENGSLAAFYAQSLVFSDYLKASSGDPSIMGSIASASARGTSFEEWLATDGAARGLPSDFPRLQEHWEAWATKNYGAPP